MEPDSSLPHSHVKHNAKQVQHMDRQQTIMFLVSLSPYMSTADIHMFGLIDVNSPKRSCPQV